MEHNNGNTVLVVGATGQLGNTIVQQLLQQGRHEVVAMVRRDDARAQRLRDAGAETRLGDLRDPASLKRALQGIDQVIATASMVVPAKGDRFGVDEVEGYQNLADACHAGIQHIVTVSAPGSDARVPEFRVKRKVEEALIASGIPTTIFRCAAFMDVYLATMGSTAPLERSTNATLHRGFWGTRLARRAIGIAEQLGVLMVPGNGKARHSVIAVEDVAAFAVSALDRVPQGARIREIAGPGDETWGEMARTLRNDALVLPTPTWACWMGAHLMSRISPAMSNLAAIMANLGNGDHVPADRFETAQEFGVKLTTVWAVPQGFMRC